MTSEEAKQAFIYVELADKNTSSVTITKPDTVREEIL